MKNNMKELLDKVIDVSERLDEAKKVYAEFDNVVQECIDAGLESVVYKGKTISLVDNFKKKNLCWKSVAFRQWELKVE